MKYKNIFYFGYLNKIGGIETFFYQLAKKYKDLDITIFYLNGDYVQIQRLKKYVRCIKYNREKIECQKAFFNFNLDIIDNVEAEEYIQILHGDYKAMGLKPNIHKKVTKYIGVSQLVCDSFKEITGIDAQLIYNPIELDKPNRVLNLISATRLTKDKGKNRMIKLSRMLDEANIPYLWTIFTDDINSIDSPNIVYMKPRLDIINYISNADYLVQLSDAEGYCYSVVESLIVGTPVIVTDMPVMKEIGVNNKNGFILDFDLSNVNVDKIYKSKFNFEYIPKVDTWDKVLAKGKSNYKGEVNMKVKATNKYKELDLNDAELKRIPEEGEIFEVSKERFDVLNGNNEHKVVFVEKVEEVKEVEDEKVKDDEEKYEEVAVKEEKKENAVKKTRKKSK